MTSPAILEKAAADLVDRSRCGDQNATAMILEIRRSALQGSTKAQKAFAILRKLVADKPVQSSKNLDMSDHMGAEANEAIHAIAHRGPILALAALVMLPDMGGETGVRAAAVVLANGPRVISKRLVSEIGEAIEEAVYRQCFFYGVKSCGAKGRRAAREVKGAGDAALFVHAGRSVGLARAIQRVRVPGSQIALFDANAAWELGEAIDPALLNAPLVRRSASKGL